MERESLKLSMKREIWAAEAALGLRAQVAVEAMGVSKITQENSTE